MKLHELQNKSRPAKRSKRVGRGVGSKRGKTSTRGHKGAGSRSGWKSRDRFEGGQLPVYRKIPERGFSNVRFQTAVDVINLEDIGNLYTAGEIVNITTLREKGFLKNVRGMLKILGNGDCAIKVTVEAHSFSKSALEKLEKSGCTISIIK